MLLSDLPMFSPTALYVKTHNKTGFKYFGKTTRLSCIHTYKGSGIHWKRHLKIHGDDYTTELLGIWQNKEKLKEFAVKFCNENNVVKSSEWANMVLEEGLQGASNGETNVSKREDVRAKMSASSARNQLGNFGVNHASFKGWYVTHLGKFDSLKSAADAHGTTLQNIHYGVYGYKYKYKGQEKFINPRKGWSFEPASFK
jgi:hypothetical protein